LTGQLSEPAFHQIQPTGAGGHKMKPETGMLLELGAHLCLVVSANSCPSPDPRRPAREILGLSSGETSRIPDAGAVDNTLPPPGLVLIPKRQTEGWSRCDTASRRALPDRAGGRCPSVRYLDRAAVPGQSACARASPSCD
jgi:hypothetical protein